MLRSDLQGTMFEVITVLLTLSQMSLWSLMRNTPNSPSALCWENGMYMCDLSAMNGVGSAVILALMRLGGKGGESADIRENWRLVALSLQVASLTLRLSSVIFWETRNGIIDVLNSLQVEWGRPERQKTYRRRKIQRRVNNCSRDDWGNLHSLLL